MFSGLTIRRTGLRGAVNLMMSYGEEGLTAKSAVQIHKNVGSSRFVPAIYGESAEYFGL